MSVTFWSDVGCPWATLAVWRWHEECRRAGLRVEIDHRAFPLELLNHRSTPKQVLDAEVPVVGALEPGFGFRLWSQPDWQWPVTTLPAIEAVQAAKEQSLVASTALDLALRRALFVDSRCISMEHVIADVAGTVDGLDVDALFEAVRSGRPRRRVAEDLEEARSDDVQGSPHVFVGDRSMANPGIEMHWEGTPGEGGYPVVDSDDSSVYGALIATASS